jgi:N,N'-diacetyllegionaminate synthase
VSMRPRVLAIIPARGGSKSVPRKNLQPVAGRPLIAWTIETARRSRTLDRVIVSTDDEEIAAVAREWGAEVPMRRPAELARDDTPGLDPVLHAVSWLADREGYEPDLVMILQPTSPLRRADDIDAAVGLLVARRALALCSVTPNPHPASWSSRLSPDGVLIDFRSDTDEPATRQAAEVTYVQNGAIFLVDREHLVRNRTLYASETLAYVMPAERSVDIDDAWQLDAVDALLSRAQRACDPVTAGGRNIGSGAPCLIVAEIGVNHDGRLDVAEQLIDQAAAVGADAVKFQTWNTDELVTADAPAAAYQRDATGAATQADLLRSLELGEDALRILKQRAERHGLLFFSSPDEESSADLLERIDVPLFKIGSGELTNLRFLRHVALKGRPMVVSTGMATLADVAAAVHAIETAGNRSLVLLHCVSSYPSPAAESNLNALDTLRSAFGCPVGFSDHTTTIETAVAAVAKGAALVEKHITLDRNRPGPDHRASFDVDQFRQLVQAIRTVESALGDGVKRPTASELPNRALVRKVMVAARPLRAGQVLAESDIAFRRAGDGLAVTELDRVVGRALKSDVDRHAPITERLVDGG